MDTISLMKELKEIDNHISSSRVSSSDPSKETLEKRAFLLKRIDENTRDKKIIFDEIIKTSALLQKNPGDSTVNYNLSSTIDRLNTIYDKL